MFKNFFKIYYIFSKSELQRKGRRGRKGKKEEREGRRERKDGRERERDLSLDGSTLGKP